MPSSTSSRLHWILALSAGLIVVALSSWAFIRYTGLNPLQPLGRGELAAACPPGAMPSAPPLKVVATKLTAGRLQLDEWTTPWSAPHTRAGFALSPLNQGQTMTDNKPGEAALLRGERRLFEVMVGPRSVKLPELTKNALRCYTAPLVAEGHAKLRDERTLDLPKGDRPGVYIETAIDYTSRDGSKRSGTISMTVVDTGEGFGGFVMFIDDAFKDKLVDSPYDSAQRLRIV